MATKVVAWRDFLSVYFKCLLEVRFFLASSSRFPYDIKKKLFENNNGTESSKLSFLENSTMEISNFISINQGQKYNT